MLKKISLIIFLLCVFVSVNAQTCEENKYEIALYSLDYQDENYRHYYALNYQSDTIGYCITHKRQAYKIWFVEEKNCKKKSQEFFISLKRKLNEKAK